MSVIYCYIASHPRIWWLKTMYYFSWLCGLAPELASAGLAWAHPSLHWYWFGCDCLVLDDLTHVSRDSEEMAKVFGPFSLYTCALILKEANPGWLARWQCFQRVRWEAPRPLKVKSWKLRSITLCVLFQSKSAAQPRFKGWGKQTPPLHEGASKNLWPSLVYHTVDILITKRSLLDYPLQLYLK